jgi:uncharacterized membrane protein
VHYERGRRLKEALDPGILTRHRLLGFGFAGLATLLVLIFSPIGLAGTTRFVAGFDAFAIMMLASYVFFALKSDAHETYRRAAIEDPGRNFVLAVVLLSCLAGLVSAIAILGRGPEVVPAERNTALALGLAAVALGWLLIHSTFGLRYAHLYYVDSGGKMRRGLQFPGTDKPDDYDFAYFSFVVGMTFQVSDVQVVDKDVRRLVLLHGLVSFAYNTAILALVVNLASGLLYTK